MPKRRAVIVGVNGREGWDFTPLKYAWEDAIRIKSLLQRIGEEAPFDDIELLLDKTDLEVREAIKRAVRGKGAGDALGPGDLFVFYFSGHGKRQAAGKYLMLCPEAERSVLDGEDTNGTVTDTFLKNTVAQGSYDCLFIYDACRSVLLASDVQHRDGALSKGVMDGERNLNDVVAARKGTGRGVCATVYSCRDGEQACELKSLKGGLFTCALDSVLRDRIARCEPLSIDSNLIYCDVLQRMKQLAGPVAAHSPGFHCEGGEGISLIPRTEPRRAPAGTSAPDKVSAIPGTIPVQDFDKRPDKGASQVLENQAVNPPWSLSRILSVVFSVALTLYVLFRVANMFRGEDTSESRAPAPAPVTFAGAPLQIEIGEGVTLDMVWCPPGEFLMGSPPGESEREENERQHRVTLTRGFWIGKYEVTQEQWQAVMGSNPSRFTGDPRLPVEQVSWEDCQAFIGRLNERGEGTFRLPTEAEWEYVCRAGTTTPFHFGSTLGTHQANYDGNYPYANGAKGEYREKTTVVGSFPPNAWGLYDMHGNVWECCQDWYGDYPSNAVTDPTGPPSGQSRVLRGGSWVVGAGDCRSAFRYNGAAPVLRYHSAGFRLLRTP